MPMQRNEYMPNKLRGKTKVLRVVKGRLRPNPKERRVFDKKVSNENRGIESY